MTARMMGAAADAGESWDVLNDPSDPGLHWTTGNIGEAVPGVQTPLSWSLWGPTIEAGMRLSMRDMGAFSHAESTLPPKGRQLCQVFYGRGALSVELLARLGDRMPGTTGQQVATGVYGDAPDTI